MIIVVIVTVIIIITIIIIIMIIIIIITIVEGHPHRSLVVVNTPRGPVTDPALEANILIL